MADLGVDTAVEPLGDGRYTATPSADWEIWGPMGGYIASFALRAAGASSPHAHPAAFRSEEHTSELQSLMRISYAVFCLKKKNTKINIRNQYIDTATKDRHKTTT